MGPRPAAATEPPIITSVVRWLGAIATTLTVGLAADIAAVGARGGGFRLMSTWADRTPVLVRQSKTLSRLAFEAAVRMARSGDKSASVLIAGYKVHVMASLLFSWMAL